jgi:hypothetical protein
MGFRIRRNGPENPRPPYRKLAVSERPSEMNANLFPGLCVSFGTQNDATQKNEHNSSDQKKCQPPQIYLSHKMGSSYVEVRVHGCVFFRDIVGDRESRPAMFRTAINLVFGRPSGVLRPLQFSQSTTLKGSRSEPGARVSNSRPFRFQGNEMPRLWILVGSTSLNWKSCGRMRSRVK